MINELWKHSSTAQELISEGRKEGRDEGRKEEALRMTRLALERRLGRLDAPLLQALEQTDIATLEDLILASTLTLEQVWAILRPHT
jgi:hypothetical protein